MPESIFKSEWLKIWHSAAYAGRFPWHRPPGQVCGTLTWFFLKQQTAKHLITLLSNRISPETQKNYTFAC
jgi:hypothetical protein